MCVCAYICLLWLWLISTVFIFCWSSWAFYLLQLQLWQQRQQQLLRQQCSLQPRPSLPPSLPWLFRLVALAYFSTFPLRPIVYSLSLCCPPSLISNFILFTSFFCAWISFKSSSLKGHSLGIPGSFLVSVKCIHLGAAAFQLNKGHLLLCFPGLFLAALRSLR